MDLTKIAPAPVEVDEQRVQWELEGYVTGHYAERATNGDEPEQRWTIENIGQAEWAMRKLAEAEDIDREYADQIERWQDARNRSVAQAAFFRDHLEQWALANRTPDRMTFRLAHGNVSTRETQATAEVADHERAAEWAKIAAPAAVHVTTEVHVRDLKSKVRVTDVLVAWSVLDKLTGERDTIGVGDEYEVAADSMQAETQRLAMLHEYPDEEAHEVRPIVERGVVDMDGNRVPGLRVKAGKITAHVNVAR